MKFALSRRISSAVLALFVVIAPHSSYASWEFLQPTKLIEKIRDQIAKQNIGLDLNLFNGDIFRGFSTALNYRLQSEPSYLDGFYTRVDRYTFQAQV
ncbi:MAG TPA: hypothetical protein VN132_13870, partial [Bdellovibrio sp.]|nr:hypothetical protein [Bdellovibrio sp.]